MEGTEAGEVLCARLLELDVVTDDADDVGLLLKGVFEVGGGHGSFDTHASTTAKGGATSFYCGAWMGGWEMAECMWMGVEACGEARGSRPAKVTVQRTGCGQRRKISARAERTLVAVQSSVNVESLGFVRDDSWEDRRRERA